MNPELALILASILIGFAVLAFLTFSGLRRLEQAQKENEANKLIAEWLKQVTEQTGASRKETQERLDVMSKTLTENLGQVSKVLGDRLDNAAKVIGAFSKELGQMSEIGRQLREFQEFLRSPKLRGGIGEQILYDLLKQTIPQEKLLIQHQFRSGQTVDAAIQTAAGLIPIDSKLPMENFKKMMSASSEAEKEAASKDFEGNVKKHIDDIAKKYILPQEGTVDFALMYVASEPVAYEIVVHHPNLAEYAYQKRIAVVSPNQFNHFLKVVMIGFEREKVSERASEILSALKAIQKDTEKFGEDFRVLVKHITNAKSMADSASISFNQLTGKIGSVQSLTPPAENSPLL